MADEPTSKTEGSSVTQYIKATTSATERTRTVVIVMLVASVVVFTQTRNADGWLDRRIDVRTHALRLLKNFNEATDLSLLNDSRKRDDEAEAYTRARYFINKLGYKVSDDNDIGRLTDEVKNLEKLRDEQLRLVRLPFFGAVFDADDMGIFAGITFTVVLLWLTLSLNRERRNTQLAFREAKAQEKSQLCYDLLSMQQVLTVPPNSQSKIWKPLGYLSKVIYIMPLAVYGYLHYQDITTRDVGFALGWDKMNTLLWTSGVCFVFILCLTVACLVTSFKITNDWTRYKRESGA